MCDHRGFSFTSSSLSLPLYLLSFFLNSFVPPIDLTSFFFFKLTDVIFIPFTQMYSLPCACPFQSLPLPPLHSPNSCYDITSHSVLFLSASCSLMHSMCSLSSVLHSPHISFPFHSSHLTFSILYRFLQSLSYVSLPFTIAGVYGISTVGKEHKKMTQKK